MRFALSQVRTCSGRRNIVLNKLQVSGTCRPCGATVFALIDCMLTGKIV